MIYFVQEPVDEFIKIGFTSKPSIKRRLSQLQISSPREIKLLFTMIGCRKQETSLHKRFRYARYRGEWFYPIPEILFYIDHFEYLKPFHEESLLGQFLRKHDIPFEQAKTLPQLWELSKYVLPCVPHSFMGGITTDDICS